MFQKTKILYALFIVLGVIFNSCDEIVSEIENANPESAEGNPNLIWWFTEDFNMTVLENLGDYVDLSLFSSGFDFSPVQTKASGPVISRTNFPAGITDISYFPTENEISPQGEMIILTIRGQFTTMRFRFYEVMSGSTLDFTIPYTGSHHLIYLQPAGKYKRRLFSQCLSATIRGSGNRELCKCAYLCTATQWQYHYQYRFSE